MNQKYAIYALDTSGYLTVTFAEEGVRAGFPSPASDYMSKPIDLNAVLVRHPSNTFILQADQDLAPEQGVLAGDILIFDRSIKPGKGDMIAYTLDGELKLEHYGAASIEEVVVWGTLIAVIKINRESVYWDIIPGEILPEEISKLKLPYLVIEQIIGKVDLNKVLIRNPASTFITVVAGDSMKDEFINDKDLLVVDKLLEHYDGCLAVCYLDGGFTLKRVKMEDGAAWLMPANPDYPKIRIAEGDDLRIWGIVTAVIKRWRI
ncbi:S24 family peptidase [Bacteroides ovatus]|uniref:S24 family peptidase n=1 Tax=Bacteroides ovatus TaxID=28116 RepID=UPI00189D2154|nr:S24 family peptidase [Bacteroides ovatus]